MQYTDEEWAQWRREQRDAARAAAAEPATGRPTGHGRDAAVSEPAGGRPTGRDAAPAEPAGAPAGGSMGMASPSMGMAELPYALPPCWAIQVPFNKNEAHSVKQFSDVKRTCNRRLKSMYNQWQMEVRSLKDGHALETTSLQTVNMTHLVKIGGLEKEVERLQRSSQASVEAMEKLEKANNQLTENCKEAAGKAAAIVERDMGIAASKAGAEQNAKAIEDLKRQMAAEFEEQRDAALQAQREEWDTRLKAQKEELETKLAAAVREAKQPYKSKLKVLKTGQLKYKGKVDKAIAAWQRKVQKLEAALHTKQTELELFKDC